MVSASESLLFLEYAIVRANFFWGSAQGYFGVTFMTSVEFTQ